MVRQSVNQYNSNTNYTEHWNCTVSHFLKWSNSLTRSAFIHHLCILGHRGAIEIVFFLLHCALASCGAVYCNRSCLWVCDSGRAVSEPYYSQRARSVCISLSAFLFIIIYSLWKAARYSWSFCVYLFHCLFVFDCTVSVCVTHPSCRLH